MKEIVAGFVGLEGARMGLSFHRDACGLDRKCHIQSKEESQVMLSASWEVTAPEENRMLRKTQDNSLRRWEGRGGW